MAAKDSRLRAWPRWLVAAAIVCLPTIQLVPLPPQIWSLLPGRATIAEAYRTAGVTLPWLPLSLTPRATEQLCLGVLPALALFLAMPHLAADAQRRLVHVAIMMGVLDVLLGLSQIVGGADSPLRFYASASLTDAAGLFANRNHSATFLSILVVLAGALLFGRPRARPAERLWLAAAGGFLLLGIAASGSRAGLALGLGACLAVAWTAIAVRREQRRARSILVWGTLAVVPLVIGIVVFGTATQRLQTDSLAGDLRWQIARTTWHAIASVFPVGGGFGSFEPLYAQHEPSDELIPAIINHAHDDWLEVTLEGGLPALLLLGAGLAYLIRETFFTGREVDRSPFPRAVQSATLAALWLCALHATIDYPLRTMAVNLVLALACGLRVATTLEDHAHADQPGRVRVPAARQRKQSNRPTGIVHRGRGAHLAGEGWRLRSSRPG